jgi:hypothetical protein
MNTFCTRCGTTEELMIRCRDFSTSETFHQRATTKDYDHAHSVEVVQQYVCVKCLWKEIAKVMLEVT